VSQDEKRTISSAQIRAGRALVRLSAEDLSEQSSVSLRTIRRAELAEADMKLTMANNLAIRRALEAAGVEFTNGDQPGVRLTKAAAGRASAALKSTAASKVERSKTGKATKPK
jgi:hypothetical protein